MLFYKGTIAQRISLSIIIYTMDYFIDFTGSLILNLLELNYLFDERVVGGSFIVVMLFKLFFFLLVLMTKFYLSKSTWSKYVGSLIISNMHWAMILVAPLLSVISIWTINLFVDSRFRSHPIFFLVLLAWLFMSAGVYYLVSSAALSEKQLREALLINAQVIKANEYIEKERNNYYYLRNMHHDYRHHIQTLHQLLLDQKYDEAVDYTNFAEKEIVDHSILINTNHIIVNAVLNAIFKTACSNDISILPQISDLSQLCVSDEDIVIILSNVLENAVGECQQLEENRIIQLKLIQTESDLVISVKNPCREKIVLPDGRFVTEKPDKNSHGIGLVSTQSRISKYGGMVAISTRNNIFHFVAVIPVCPH